MKIDLDGSLVVEPAHPNDFRILLFYKGALAGYALVSPEDAALGRFRWRLHYCGGKAYAIRTLPGQRIAYMHREILGLAHGDPRTADHINGNGLDNRRSNLRVATREENQQNRRGSNQNSRSGIRGVVWASRDRRWVATGGVRYKKVHIGSFLTREEAKHAVAAWRRDHMPFSGEAP